MSLKEYEEKRTFSKTPEPKPSADPQSRGDFFCIQRHDATRLHYDFRLEIDGVLKSWAVPKGPTLEPLAKHLAMHVEDHPIEYGNFEGNIPKGEYGGGSVMLWDRGTFELLGDAPAQEQIRRGDLKFRLHGEKVNGEFAIVLMKGRGKGNEWLLIKKKDADAQPGWNIEDHAYSVLTGRTQQEIADNAPSRKLMPDGAVQADMPDAIDPMQAESASQPPKGDDWLYEIKWDGVRALCFLTNQQLRIFSRRGNRCDQQYPELAGLPRAVHATTAILDGEIAVLDENGRPCFGSIQPRIHQSDANAIAHLARTSPATLFLFDLLYLNGYDLRDVPLIERKRLLERIVTPGDHVKVSSHFAGVGPEMLEAAKQNGLEGVMAKRPDSKYESRRSWNWLKIKVSNQQEFVICGFLHDGNRAYFSSLVLGLYQGDELVHVGQVGTGFNDKSLSDIFHTLEPLITAEKPFDAKLKGVARKVTWVKPVLVCEVKFLEFTKDGILRAPVFLGLRDDKDPHDCVRERALQDAPEPIPEAPAEQKFNNLTKIFYPNDGVTKGDVIQYYGDVATYILPHLRDRPLSLKRYPNGIHADYFFQKNVGDRKFPTWIRTEPIDGIEYAICNDKPTLVYLANLGCIDQNPWMSRIGSLDNPDFVLIDLDPYECTYDLIVEAALLTRQTLDSIGLEGYPKTTGGDGMHLYIPVEPVYTYEQVRQFAEVLWHLIVGREPKLFTTPRAVAQRTKGRVYFDYLQIGRSKTIAAPYVLRAHDGAPVAAPLAWKEVKKGLTPAQFNIKNAVERFRKVGDLFAPVLTNLQRIEEPLEKLGDLLRKRAQ
jgi:bifunctional non-homologous end joining protein LigD